MKISREEFERLAMEHMNMLYRIARRLTRDQASAEDLVQETYLRAFRARDGFDLQQYGIRPWLVRIMHNLNLSQSKRGGRQPVVVENEVLDSGATTSGTSLPLSPASFEGMDERLVKAVNQLPEEYQTVLLLWAVEDFSYKEIAAAVDVPIGTVMSRLHRARERLSAQLKDFAKKEGIVRE
ncbi:MAG TPA: sigma-70 family RNA polymerase sigma factor [Tepidisphaeraceae bacterium]|jgi:RNA polymerase sigma-70 factor (ECF subfamily)|nr:sigma-70 family RNA polymerase sigma factor [Tepidisphaeraceae bacterium]